VHRWDAENATGRARPIAASLAPDGVDEVLDVHLEPDDPPFTGHGGLVRFRSTDVGRSWALKLTEGERPMRGDETAEPDLTIRGSSSDLLLLLWGRNRLEDLAADGDTAIWDAFNAYPEG
jgi:hypothetical protein